MKKVFTIVSVLLTLALLAFTLTSCADTTTANTKTETNAAESSTGETVTAADLEALANEGDVTVDQSGATKISLNGSSVSVSGSGAAANGSTVTVSAGGTYELSGTLTDGRVIVDAEGEEVTLILNGANITCSYSSAIYVYEAKSATVYLAAGTENTLSDGSSYTYNDSYSSEADEEPNACLYAKDDLVIAGSGKLTVNGNADNGITSKDTLKIESVNLTVNAKNHAIKGKDDLIIKSGAYTLNCSGDALHGDANTTILNGEFSITGSDDGIHADNTVTINNGTFTIDAHEGVEGTIIKINDGTVTINASDDGINAAKKIDGVTPLVEINGGNITINMGQGDTDGVDSNGDIVINGGTISVNGQSPFDYDGTATVNGGTVYANGEQVTTLTNQFGGGMQGERGGQRPEQDGSSDQGGQPPQGGRNRQKPTETT